MPAMAGTVCKGGGALCAGTAGAILVFCPVMRDRSSIRPKSCPLFRTVGLLVFETFPPSAVLDCLTAFYLRRNRSAVGSRHTRGCVQCPVPHQSREFHRHNLCAFGGRQLANATYLVDKYKEAYYIVPVWNPLYKEILPMPPWRPFHSNIRYCY